MAEILALLSAGGDAAMIAVAWAFWRIDRRILRIETFLETKLNFGD